MSARPSRENATVAPAPTALVTIPVSAGELIDKITILTLKAGRVCDASKRAMAARELALLRLAAGPLFSSERAGLMVELTESLEEINAALWDVEDSLRAMERDGEFGPAFVEAARCVYRLNDERARLKNEVSAAAGCSLREVKEHPDY
ncbi:MAG TPA: hypothetical protein VMU18_03165 [Rhodoblastus sp.]|nr:hypothetical protein [Rhodoblastus sp.]